MFAKKRIPINIDQSTQKPFSAHVCLTTWRKDFLYPSRFPLHQRSALRDARWAWFHRSKWKNLASFLSRMDVTIWKRDSLKVSRDYDAITYYLLRRKSLWFQPRHLINPSGRKRSVIKKSKRKNLNWTQYVWLWAVNAKELLNPVLKSAKNQVLLFVSR